MIAPPIAGIYAAPSLSAEQPSLLAGELRLLGRRNSYGAIVQVNEGDLPACTPLYNFDTGEIETVYQRYRILNSGDSEMPTFCALAIDGDYAICGELEDFGSHRHVAITPYHYDVGIKLTAAWEATSTIKEGVDLNLIDVGEYYIVRDVVKIQPGKFAIVTGYSGPDITTYQIKIVTYTTPLAFTVETVECDLVAIGVVDYRYEVAFAKMAINIDTLKLAVSLNMRSTQNNNFGSVIFTLDAKTFQLTDSVVNLVEPDRPPLAGLAAINERCFDLQLTSFYYKNCIASFSGMYIFYATNNYGTYVEYKDYTARSIGSDGNVEYSDLTPLTTIVIPPLMYAKLTDLGFTLSGPEFSPTFGGLGAYII